MAENFMSKPKSVVPQTKKIYGKATFKGIKPKIPKAKEQAEPIENAPTLKEVEAEIRQQSNVEEPMVGQCPHPSAKESLEKEVKIEAEEVDEPFTDPEDDDKFEDKIEEEMYEEVNKPEPEPVPEPEPEKPKTRKRTSRKKKETLANVNISVESSSTIVKRNIDSHRRILNQLFSYLSAYERTIAVD